MPKFFPFTQIQAAEPQLITPMATIILAIKYSQMNGERIEDLQSSIVGWLYQYMSSNNLRIIVNPEPYDKHKGDHNYVLYHPEPLVFEKIK